MKSTFICLHCGGTFQFNPCSKHQKYCSAKACQNGRRNTTNRELLRKSKKSRSLRQARNKRYRDTRPAHEYQQEYRKSNPEYERRNRELQRERNKKRQKGPGQMIVKTYALSPQPLQDGAYMGFEVKNKKIVKTYALMAQMQSQPDMEVYSRSNPG